MKLRVARHTADLQPLVNFYTEILGLQVIGDFKDHSNYDGVFIGGHNAEWHLEFTVSDEQPVHQADEDDLLVFYPSSADEFKIIHDRIISNNVLQVAAKNPYWEENGITIVDPDGFRVVIAAL